MDCVAGGNSVFDVKHSAKNVPFNVLTSFWNLVPDESKMLFYSIAHPMLCRCGVIFGETLASTGGQNGGRNNFLKTGVNQFNCPTCVHELTRSQRVLDLSIFCARDH